MKKINMGKLTVTSILLILMMLCAYGSVLKATETEINRENVAEFVDDFFATKLEEYHVPGAVFIFVKDGNVIYSNGYGYADLEKKKKPDPALTTYRVASNSKLLVATAVMQLYQQGKLDLDTDINSYLDVKLIPGKSYKPVTLRNLLTHTPGFDDINVRMSTLDKQKRLTLEEFIKNRVPDRVYQTGEVTSYSNYGYALAGYIVERVSGQSFSSYVENNIFKPLGMTSSSFVINNSLKDRLATPYVYMDASYDVLPYDYIYPYPAATLVTTAKDMARFMIMHLDNGRYGSQRILDDKTASFMHRQQFTNHERLPGMTFGYIEDVVNGIRILTHGGWAAGFKTTQVLIPANNAGYFISANYEYPLGKQYKIYDDFKNSFFDHFFKGFEKIQKAEQFSTDINVFKGNYRNNRYDRDTIAKLGVLLNDVKVRVLDDTSLKIKDKVYTRYGNTLFMEKDGNEKAGFRLEDRGRASFLFMASSPTSGYERLPWYETSGFHMILLAACIILFITSPLFFYIFYSKNEYAENSLSRFYKGTYILSSANGILLVLFLAATGLVLLTTVQISLWWETPPLIPFLLVIPLISILCTLYMLYVSARMWKKREGGSIERSYFSVITLACVVFLLFLNYFNLVGYHV